MRSVRILGVPIHAVTMEEALKYATDCTQNMEPRLLMTPNAEILYSASKDQDLKDLLLQADMRIADGSGLVWAARFSGTPLPERVTGIDLMYRLLDCAANRGTRVFFLGARPEVVLNARNAAVERWQGLNICGVHHGYFSFEEEPAIRLQIKQTEPDILFVGMGAPRQEDWMVRNKDALNIPLMMGVGGSFDILSGHLPRAPVWMRESGLEWLFRLWREPKRIRRMGQLPLFVGAVVREKYFTGRHAGNYEE
jgi:N-acetylglucosaminyldiphosphoundecaprenol N-acetyl-beta-D-mannosaminyltransferase